MSKSKKPNRKPQKLTRNWFKHIKTVQATFRDFVCGATQIAEQANYTWFKGREYEKPTQYMAEALQYIKFDWQVLLGVVSRSKNGDHSITYKSMFSNKQYTLYELSEDAFSELRSMFDAEDHDLRLTTFWVASPNQDEDLRHHALKLLHKYRVPDNMITQYELREKGEDNVPRSYCETYYWMGHIDWYEIKLEEC